MLTKDKSATVFFENVSYLYEDTERPALENISFSLEEGEFLAVLGPNGAGKTTLCFLLSGVCPGIWGGKIKGQINIFGQDPWIQPIYETARTVGIVLQDPETQLLMPEVDMELAFGPANFGVPKEEIIKRTKEALDIVGLPGFEDRTPQELSGGQKQRIALAATWCMQPRLLVLDEPTSQLDPLGTVEVLDAIHQLKKEGKVTTIMVTHKTDEIVDLADKVLILKDGKGVDYGPTKEVLSRTELLEKNGVRPPDISQLFLKLQKNGIQVDSQISLEEGIEKIEPLFKEGRVTVKRALSEEGKKEQGDPILVAENLSYSYKGYEHIMALKNINLKIYEGEFVGIIGQNGSGKTTLVKNFVGLLQPTEGKAFFKDDDLSKLEVSDVARKVGMVLQNPDYQLFTISADKEIRFGLKNIGVPEEEMEDRVLEALKVVDLEKEYDTFPFRLSFGDRRKLAVATVLVMRPEILIMDEPTTAQDYWGRYLLADLAKDLFEKGLLKTVIMITHDMSLVSKFADRLIVMADGEIIADGPTRDVFYQQDVLKQAFLKPPQMAQLASVLQGYKIPQNVLSVEDMAHILF
ncbi:MAG: ABC transporter ATP-binding protein [Promethearchaeota archaeon]